jgi:hypothetical protein
MAGVIKHQFRPFVILPGSNYLFPDNPNPAVYLPDGGFYEEDLIPVIDAPHFRKDLGNSPGVAYRITQHNPAAAAVIGPDKNPKTPGTVKPGAPGRPPGFRRAYFPQKDQTKAK